MGRAFRFDSESDVAALVYGRTDEPDLLLADFAADLLAQGFDPAGFVQRRGVSPTRSRPCPELVCVATGVSIGFIQPGPAGTPSAARAEILPDARDWLLRALARRPDLILINRFGSMEQAGGGLIEVMLEAVAAGVPVLLAVPEALFGDWRGFSEGLAVRLECRRTSLDQWWRSLGKTSPPRPESASFCEQFK